jgi:hypothetical protein
MRTAPVVELTHAETVLDKGAAQARGAPLQKTITNVAENSSWQSILTFTGNPLSYFT